LKKLHIVSIFLENVNAVPFLPPIFITPQIQHEILLGKLAIFLENANAAKARHQQGAKVKGHVYLHINLLQFSIF